MIVLPNMLAIRSAKVVRQLVLLLATASLFSIASTAAAQEKSNDLRVMSFNIRYGKANDGDNHWDNRHDLVAETAREFNPDLMGTQETLKFQADFLAEQFPDYTAFGRTREKEGEDGEQCAIFYRTERFTKIGGGHLWLSKSPNKPGTKSWDSSLPRMITWLCLRDKKNPETPICFFNTHFDHRGKVARKRSAELLAKKSVAIAKSFDARIIITGDFNTDEGSDPYKEIVTDDDDSLVDTYRATHKEKAKNEGTFNGFSGTDTGARIDWVLVDQSWKIKSAEIVKKNKDGRYPSDHFPVTAILAVE